MLCFELYERWLYNALLLLRLNETALMSSIWLFAPRKCDARTQHFRGIHYKCRRLHFVSVSVHRWQQKQISIFSVSSSTFMCETGGSEYEWVLLTTETIWMVLVYLRLNERWNWERSNYMMCVCCIVSKPFFFFFILSHRTIFFFVVSWFSSNLSRFSFWDGEGEDEEQKKQNLHNFDFGCLFLWCSNEKTSNWDILNKFSFSHSRLVKWVTWHCSNI